MRPPRVRCEVRRMMVAVAVVAVMPTAPGCSVERPSTSATATPSAPTTQDPPYREDPSHLYDDPRFSPDERRAVRAATEAVRALEPARPRPNFDDAFRYGVGKEEDGWFVMVTYVHGFDEDGRPRFAPGGHTAVMLDRNFNVKDIIGGE